MEPSETGLTGNEDFYVIYQHIKTPVVVSNRCAINTIYQIDQEDGGFLHFTTSKGTGQIASDNAALIGKDVLSNCVLTYTKVEKVSEGRIRATQVICVDPAGDIPQWMKKKIAKSNADGMANTIKHLR